MKRGAQGTWGQAPDFALVKSVERFKIVVRAKSCASPRAGWKIFLSIEKNLLFSTWKDRGGLQEEW
jgi:hypothetical protein